MSKLVAAISMSHAPGMLGWPDHPPADMRRDMQRAVDETAAYLEAAKPDLIVAILDDHFENLYRNLMPVFAIGVANQHVGPAKYWLEALQLKKQTVFGGAPREAEALLRAMVERGFDVARMGEIEYGNNLMVPIQFIRPAGDIPIVPVFVNVFSAPVATTRRAYGFGVALGEAIEALPGDLRVAVLATGGLSHWPPFWRDRPEDQQGFLTRMKRFQTEGRAVLEDDPHLMTDLGAYEIDMARTSTVPLVNERWDRAILDAYARGDVDFITSLTNDEIESQGGHGGLEILNWTVTMGAVRGRRARVLGYQPCVEWICGMGFLVYDL
ncbi:extradiol dioxygenase [Paraburkholderia sp. ZP32-5]|uniref:DODA-type extradiol aromatic ring-opening family dioxygenase n=1 Tax=Paraburkholderia sp. ZP32-5 TaxID=2883245 RepID=UPI001F3737AC|nr:extradiol dioxygenase [Paraburkholderia sp. ZP32-5]